MEFEWDEAKRRANYRNHGLDFRDAEKVFQGITLAAEDDQQDYGEKHLISLGRLIEKLQQHHFEHQHRVPGPTRQG